MPRRKPNKKPDPTDRISLEETQEMWTVGSPGTPETPGIAPEPEPGTGTDEPRAGRERDTEGPTAGEPEVGIDPEAETVVVAGDDEWSWEEVTEREPAGAPVEADEWEEDPADDPDDGWYDEDPDDAGEGSVSVWGENEEPDDVTGEWEDEAPDDPGNDPTEEWAEGDGSGHPENGPHGDWQKPEPDGQAATSAVPSRRSIGDRLSALNLPDIPDPDPRHLLAAVAVAAVALAVGYGTYELGRGSGEDIDAARIRGEAAGRQAGAAEGAARGYPAGFQKGRDKGFARTYRETYRIHYKRAFEQAGLDVPKDKDIDVPAP